MSGRGEAVGYLLGELNPAGRAEAERRMAGDPAFRDEVERLRPVVARLESLPDAAWAPPAPPALAAPPGSATARGRPAWLRPVAAAALACGLLGLGLALGLLIGRAGGGDTTVGRQLALRPVGAGDGGAGGVARLVGRDHGRVRVQVHGLAPTGDGRFYELWLMSSPSDLVAVATFRVPASGRATVEVPLAVDPSRFKYFDLSLEPVDGNPRHSGDSVLRGQTV